MARARRILDMSSTGEPGARKLKVLLISADEFSGVRPGVMAALTRAGCEVVYRRQTLRELGALRYWHLLRMRVSARWLYGRAARVLVERTRAAFIARSRVNSLLVNQHLDVDGVILLIANSGYDATLSQRRPRLIIYTDYGNLLSKALPDHGFALYERKVHASWNELEREALLVQDRVYVMGAGVRDAMESAYRMPAGKIIAVGAGPGLDLDVVRDAGVKDASNRTILFVGKLAAVKGLGVLLEAFSAVRAVFSDAVLHVVTVDPVVAPGVVSHQRLSESELKDLFYRCSIFAMPAFKEPLGLVFLEAMLSKCACVGTTVGSMPELIQDGVTGYVVQPGDPSALAARLIDLLGDPVKTRAMGERGYLAVKDYWNWDGVVQRMLGDLRPGAEPPPHRS
jgi:glycosyltransferase involved in cell wall biosynthesis